MHRRPIIPTPASSEIQEIASAHLVGDEDVRHSKSQPSYFPHPVVVVVVVVNSAVVVGQLHRVVVVDVVRPVVGGGFVVVVVAAEALLVPAARGVPHIVVVAIEGTVHVVEGPRVHVVVHEDARSVFELALVVVVVATVPPTCAAVVVVRRQPIVDVVDVVVRRPTSVDVVVVEEGIVVREEEDVVVCCGTAVKVRLAVTVGNVECEKTVWRPPSWQCHQRPCPRQMVEQPVSARLLVVVAHARAVVVMPVVVVVCVRRCWWSDEPTAVAS